MRVLGKNVVVIIFCSRLVLLLPASCFSTNWTVSPSLEEVPPETLEEPATGSSIRFSQRWTAWAARRMSSSSEQQTDQTSSILQSFGKWKTVLN